MNRSTPSTDATPTPLGQPLALPCGVILKNRLIKSPMSDSLGDGAGNATAGQIRLYERWAQGGAALSVIGEAQVVADNPEKPGNLVLDPEADLSALAQLAKRGAAQGAEIWPQLGHAGALSHAPISRPKGPSPLNVAGLTCEGLNQEEITALPVAYARAAKLAKSAGFGGVQIHAGHGFLFSQFLSPLFNHRADSYGGSVPNRFRIIGETLAAVRRSVGPGFAIGIRINATDKLQGGLTGEDALQVVRLLDKTSVDLIDISGGTYFPGAKSSSEGQSSGQPYFLEFARRAKTATSLPVSLTGGFKTRAQAAAAISEGAADAIGLARALVLNPDLANNWISGPGADPEFPEFNSRVPGGVTAWYSMRLTALGADLEEEFDLSLDEALDRYEARDADRCRIWLNRFARSAG